MKKTGLILTALMLSAVMMFCSFASTAAAGVSVKLNGQLLDFEQPPVIINERTLVPLRAIFEALGASVEWDGATKTVTSIKGDVTVKLSIGSNVLYRNNVPVELDVPAQIVGAGYTMVPARAVAESFGVVVGWEDATKTVLLTTSEEEKQESKNPYENLKGLVYDFASGDDGWKAYAKACTGSVENGILKVVSVEGVNDPQIAKNGLTVDTTKYDRVVIRFKYDNYGKAEKMCNLYFASDVTGGFNEAKNTKAFYNECYVDEEGYTWAEFALFRNENWKGTCTALRFDPASGGNGTYLVDKIVIVEKDSNAAVTPIQPKPDEAKTENVPSTPSTNVTGGKYDGLKGLVYDFSSGDDGWKTYAKACTGSVENGILKVVSVEGVNDPQISKTGLTVDTTKYDKVVVRFKYDNYGKEDKMCNLYFASDVTGGYNEAKNTKVYYNECYVDEEGYTWAEFVLFRNENWKGTCTAMRFDPASGGNGTYLIDKIIITEKENGTSTPSAAVTGGKYDGITGMVYDFASGDDGWKAYAKACTGSVENGILKVVSLEGVNDPQIAKTGLSVDTTKYDRLVIRFKYDNYGKAEKTCNIYFATDVTGGYNEAKNIKAYYNECYVDEEGYTWAEFALSRNENWKGTCTAIRFDPASGGNGEYLVDKIIIVESGASAGTAPSTTPSATPSQPAQSTTAPVVAAPQVKIETLSDCQNATGTVFDFNGDIEGWKPHAKMLTSEVKDGVVKLTSLPDAKDPQFTKTGLSISTDACKTILVKYKWTSNGSDYAELFFATDSDPTISESKKLKGYFNSYFEDGDGFKWAVFDMSQNENWKGICKTVRFDPIASGNGEFVIDKIVFVSAQTQQAQADTTGKKRLMLVGDSIAFEYGPHLMKMISDEYVMYEKEGREVAAQNLDVAVGGNAGDSKNVVKFVKQMESEGRFNFDLFLFNCGLHDLKRNKPDRALQVSITDYEANLREVVAICKKNNVPVIFVDITPIIDTRYGEDAEFTRKNEDVIAYNEVAVKVMKENNVPVIGLNEYTLSLGQISTTMRDHAHYYTDIQEKQARFIADFILSK